MTIDSTIPTHHRPPSSMSPWRTTTASHHWPEGHLSVHASSCVFPFDPLTNTRLRWRLWRRRPGAQPYHYPPTPSSSPLRAISFQLLSAPDRPLLAHPSSCVLPWGLSSTSRQPASAAGGGTTFGPGYSTIHLASVLFSRSLSSIGGSTVIIIITSCHCHP